MSKPDSRPWPFWIKALVFVVNIGLLWWGSLFLFFGDDMIERWPFIAITLIVLIISVRAYRRQR